MESSNGKLRDDLLNGEIFYALTEATASRTEGVLLRKSLSSNCSITESKNFNTCQRIGAIPVQAIITDCHQPLVSRHGVAFIGPGKHCGVISTVPVESVVPSASSQYVVPGIPRQRIGVTVSSQACIVVSRQSHVPQVL